MDGGISSRKTVLSQEEIRGIIKAFILAYVRGSIKISHPNAQTILNKTKLEGEPVDFKTAHKQEMGGKNMFRQLIGVVSGSKPSTEAELAGATERLFQVILSLRNGGRIAGEFMEFKFEEKMSELERKLEATNNLVEQLVNWLTEEARAS